MNIFTRRRLFNRKRCNLRDDTGQALVEFALVMPLLLILVVGVIEFGRGWNAYQVITDAAREGARRVAVTRADAAAVTPVVHNALRSASFDPALSRVTVLPGAGTGAPSSVTVDYRYRFTFLGPLLNWAGDRTTITLRSTAVMRNE